MQRFSRIFVNIAAIVSLLLSLTVGWLWVRGHTTYDDLGMVTTSKSIEFRRERHYALGSKVGGLVWQITTYEWTTAKAIASDPRREDTHFWRNVLEAKERFPEHVARDRFGGFNISRSRYDAFDPEKIYSYRVVAVRTPMWFVLVVVSSPAVLRTVSIFAARSKRARRHNVGLCLACGYDIRASPMQCPECGEIRRVA